MFGHVKFVKLLHYSTILLHYFNSFYLSIIECFVLQNFFVQFHPVDLGVLNQPIRFKVSVRTENPLSWVSQNATDHPPTAVCKENQWGHETQISPIVHSGLHVLEVTNLNVVASNLLRTCFKSQSLPNSISTSNCMFLGQFGINSPS